jgi:hypothetical protein
MKEEAIIKMEFLLTLNDNIVVQRFYNVRNFNPQARHSYDLPYFMKQVEDDLVTDLKMKTVMYMMDTQEAIYLDPEILNTSNTDDPENFNMYVKLADDVIFHRIFDGKLYPPKVRYTVDVRPSLKNILKGLTDIFSAENLCYDYMDYDLSR